MRKILGIALVCLVPIACASSDPSGTDCDPAVEDCVDAAVNETIDASSPFDADTTDAGPMFGFGEPCQDKGQCDSNICILAGPGGICSETCVAGSCPEGYGCFGVFGAIEPGVVADVCVPLNTTLCTPCSVASECAVIGNDQCLTDDLDKSFCAQDCSNVDCPAGYTCTTVNLGGTDFEQCLPDSGYCDCNASNQGATESCDITNDFGTCQGIRTCAGASGWGGCDPPGSVDVPDAAFFDDNCDGIDGDVTRGLFVAKTGLDSSTCGLSHLDPCATIGHGIIRALTASRGELYIQVGDYSEVVVMQNGIDLYGGYDVNWERDDHGQLPHRVRIIGGLHSPTGQFMTIRADGLIVPTVIADVLIVGPNASGQFSTSGRGSFAVYARNTSGLLLERITIEAGDGADGANGVPGINAPLIGPIAQMHGGDGGEADEFLSCNDDDSGAGGVRGTNTCSNARAGDGGDGGTMDNDCPFSLTAQPGEVGSNASVFQPGGFGAGGAGGAGGETCNPGVGGNNGNITNGARGNGASSGGAIVSDFWRTSAGTSGLVGQQGNGGGGGGGSGGCDKGVDSWGAGGGGGGAGGCRASAGGGGGFGGGGSFGVFARSSTISLQNCAIARGAGGKGGNGGTGGQGQSPGTGGDGGLADGDSKVGGNGGNGGHGGHGGGGGGGAGGNSVGILSSSSGVTQNCTFAGGGAGGGGSGGVSAPNAPVPERDGNNGTSGSSGSVLTVVTL